jgi:hypothetical protein
MSYLAAQAAGGFLQAPVAHFQTNLILRKAFACDADLSASSSSDKTDSQPSTGTTGLTMTLPRRLGRQECLSYGVLVSLAAIA